MNDHITRLITATALGAIASALLIVLLTIGGEEWAPLKNWLKATFFHHWLGKSYLSIALFALITAVSYPFTKHARSTRVLWLCFGIAALSACALIVFFVLHVLHLV